MTIEQAKSELMQIYGALSPDKQRAIDMLVKIEPCEDEYIKVPKKALKYRTAGMVAYNAEWLKNHFDIERVAICGAQEPCEDAISRKAVLDIINSDWKYEGMEQYVNNLPSVNPQEPKIGHWIMKHRTHNETKLYTGRDNMGETHTISVLERYEVDEPYCSECGKLAGDTSQNYCCACGAKMESEDKE